MRRANKFLTIVISLYVVALGFAYHASTPLPGDVATLSECSDPYKTTIKVGSATFALPNTTSEPSGEYDPRNHRGLLSIPISKRRNDSRLRPDCNKADQRVADFGRYLSFVFYGDGSEPATYRMDDRMYTLVDIYRFPGPAPAQYDYLTDASNVGSVKLRRSWTQASSLKKGGFATTYEFYAGNRSYAISCEIHDDRFFRNGYKHPRPPFPSICNKKMRFQAGDVTIGITQNMVLNAGINSVAIPPERWPEQWTYVLRKILSYQIEGRRKAGEDSHGKIPR